jgi:ribose transport system permease protein
MRRARAAESGKVEARHISPMKRFFLQPYSSAVTACVLLLLLFSVFTDSFLSAFNLFNLSRTVANYGFIAAAQLMVVVIGGMNLSVGSVGALATVASGFMMQNLHMNSLAVVVVTIGVGALCGLLNGVLITRLKLAPFVITLAMSFVYDGIATGISHGYSYALNEGFSAVGRGRMLGTSTLCVFLVVLVLMLVVMFRYTIFGRNVLATGGNVNAARLSGIKVDRVVILCNVLSCALAAVASMLWTSKTGTASPTTGSDWMLFSFAVCAIGGISLAGGNFTAIGFFCGACILTMVRNGLTMMHVDIYFEETFIGAVILIAVSIESLRSRVARNMII